MRHSAALATVMVQLLDLPRGAARLAAFKAVDIIVNRSDATKPELRRARNVLRAALPDLTAIVDQLWSARGGGET